ncbi:MAG: ribosome-associated translation inhibitor RaiA [Hyphomicrobiales bacterium]|nr:ribosome-associated translation inhibitor RaiA [Hyphomicrobiales bacterium]MDE2016497.1 ribosome-associated translation inhibitor RaiA [Hyphomicrobiales bacterium]
MSIRVSGKNLEIGDALRGRVLARVEGALAKHFDGTASGHVTLEPDGAAYRADCALHLSSGVTLLAEGRAHDPYASCDQAVERIEKRMRRYQRRLKGRHTAAPDGAGDTYSSYVIERPDHEAEEEPEAHAGPAIVAESTKALRELSTASAVAELDLAGAPVLVFRHASSGRVNVVYRRADGNIGWVDPK